MDEKILAWHFLPDDGRMQFGKRELVKAGKTYVISTRTKKLSPCVWGLHASERAVDALSYAPGSMICRVELGGQILCDRDKFCATERRVLWMADASRTLHEFSTWVAEWIVDHLEAKGYEIDARSRGGIEAKRRWLAGEITDQELAAARAAAGDAAGDAAWAAVGAAARAAAWAAAAAWDAARAAAWAAAAAWDAARAAAWAAVGAAARAAAWAAVGAWDAARAAAWAAVGAAARAAAWDALNTKLTEMLLALEPAEMSGGGKWPGRQGRSHDDPA